MRPDDADSIGPTTTETSAADRSPTDPDLDKDRVQSRANLLPEELSVGSDDPEAQAEIILEDSERRTEEPGAAPTTFVEHRSSDDAT